MKQDVIRRIIKQIRNKKFRNILIKKVQNNEDLSLQESRKIYDNVEFGDKVQMTKKRILDLDWTDHAEYRGELRGIDPENMNESIKDKLKNKFMKDPQSKGKEKFKNNPGTAVVDYDLRDNPAEADIVTTWASDLKFSSTNQAIQYLADLTNKTIKID